MSDEELAALISAAASGVKTVEYAGGKRITYQDLDQMRALIASEQARRAGPARVSGYNPSFSKGT